MDLRDLFMSTRRARVLVLPSINRVHAGDIATFQCGITGRDRGYQYKWNTHYSIVKDNRFRFENNGKTLHILKVKDMDNNRNVTCSVSSKRGATLEGYGRLLVLPSETITTTPLTQSLPLTTISTVSHHHPTSNQPLATSDGSNLTVPLISLGSLALVSLIFFLVGLFLKRMLSRRKGSMFKNLSSSSVNYRNNNQVVELHNDMTYGYDQIRNTKVHSEHYDEVLIKSITSEYLGNRGVEPTPHNTRRYTHASTNKQRLKSKPVPHHRSTPCLYVNTSTDGYDNAMLNGQSGGLTSGYDHLLRSNPGTLHQIPSGQSTMSEYSNLSSGVTHVSFGHVGGNTIENSFDSNNITDSISMTSKPTPTMSKHFFELCEDPQLRYASLYMDNDNGNSSIDVVKSPDHHHHKTTYARILHIIKVLRTQRGTSVEIIDC